MNALRDEQTELVPIAETKTSTLALVNEAGAVQIVNAGDRVYAEKLSEALKNASDKWDEITGPNKKKAYEAYQSALRLHDDLIAELNGARKGLKQKCIAFDAEQERIRLAEERRLQEEARKAAEEEALAAAEAEAAAGNHDVAEAILAAPAAAPQVTVARTAPAPSKLTRGRSNWKAEVFDLMALVKAVAGGTQPITLLEANMVALNQMARAAKSELRIPGVRAVEEKV